VLFRVHECPTGEERGSRLGFVGGLGLDLPGCEKPTPRDYQTLIAQVAERRAANVIQTMMLRSLSQAVYAPENEGHFGLHYDAYAHFTSPIRRYPDLLVHRGIRSVIRSERKNKHVRRAKAGVIPAKRVFPYDIAAMVVMGETCSMTERRADDATREVEAWLKCEYLESHIGDEFDGVVAAVTSFGLFVELANIYIEGLVHISSLPSDYYHFDAGKQRLSGERSGRSFNLGDPVRVQVARVSLEDKKIDLEMLESGARKKGPGNRAPRGADAAAKKSGKKPTKRGPRRSGKKPAKKSGKPAETRKRR